MTRRRWRSTTALRSNRARSRGYPFLEKALEPGALNALHIFDNERAAVYIDDCCHYTLAGNRLLADFIARAVLASK